ncbi:MarR family winged helix-turn-helix transcriptional regulator [Paracoccus marinaquae]|uniref:MarR family winged helix-turn-helix transcriptional regulator n=1 Tax=Paracoccus marinaquae TaxID=2841926 RepID=A0ABS6AMS9_9RHOB|nr:MarR family winged helix-turn-helix transcriptional regulator [Paracoccus marinaquae]MBU3031898.1 MarR family winged helix-turn-helix transcriptional regulator [Paracoccus marinaquae]
MAFSRNDSPGYLTNHLARLFAAGLQSRIKPLGLSTGIFPIMLCLWEKDGQTQRDLVVKVGIEQATLANSLSRMERDRLIERHGDDEDGRIKRNWLTERGKSLRDPAIAAAMAQNTEALHGLSPEERAEFLRLLKKMVATFGADARPA